MLLGTSAASRSGSRRRRDGGGTGGSWLYMHVREYLAIGGSERIGIHKCAHMIQHSGALARRNRITELKIFARRQRLRRQKCSSIATLVQLTRAHAGLRTMSASYFRVEKKHGGGGQTAGAVRSVSCLPCSHVLAPAGCLSLSYLSLSMSSRSMCAR